MRAVNWNSIEDPIDKQVWDRLTANFWLPEKVPVANDIPSWEKMTEVERDVIRKTFVTLTMLDTLQSELGAPTLADFASTQHESAVYSNIHFMESVHAKSYSTIFSTLCSSKEIDDLFRWAEQDELLQQQTETIGHVYDHSAYPGFIMAASVFLESMLFYTGFYAPLRFAAEGKLTNTADIIRLILRDEGVHGYYIGYKAQKWLDTNIDRELVQELLQSLYRTELLRVEQLYDEIGWAEEVKSFLRYNANKALANLGMEPMFEPHETHVPAYILAALDPGTGEAHDFFSGSGASYVMGTAEETQDEDWEF